jgi:hypothetical protein
VGPAEVMTDVEQRQLLTQPCVMFAHRVDPATNGRYMLTDVPIEPGGGFWLRPTNGLGSRERLCRGSWGVGIGWKRASGLFGHSQ